MLLALYGYFSQKQSKMNRFPMHWEIGGRYEQIFWRTLQLSYTQAWCNSFYLKKYFTAFKATRAAKKMNC